MQTDAEMDKEKWSNLLCQTISAMCKSSIIGQDVLRVQGLVGITLCNKEVFLVDISEHFEPFLGNVELPTKVSQKRKNSNPKLYRVSDTKYDDLNNQEPDTAKNDDSSNNNGNVQIISPKCDSNQDYWDNNSHSNDTQQSNQQYRTYNDNTNYYSCNNDKTNSNNNNNKTNNNRNNYLDNQQQFNNNNNNFKAPNNPQSQFDPLNQLESFTSKQITTPVKKLRTRKEFSQTVATTKHTAEILGYQDFSPFSSRPYTCKLCDACFSKRFCLANHIVTVHQVGGKYVCEMCSRQFLQRNRYMLHIEKHLNDGSRLVCPECGKNFTIRSNYENHLKKCAASNNAANNTNNNNNVGNNNNNNNNNNCLNDISRSSKGSTRDGGVNKTIANRPINANCSNNNNNNSNSNNSHNSRNNNSNSNINNNNNNINSNINDLNNIDMIKSETMTRKDKMGLSFDSFDDVMQEEGAVVDGGRVVDAVVDGRGVVDGVVAGELMEHVPIKQEDLLLFDLQN